MVAGAASAAVARTWIAARLQRKFAAGSAALSVVLIRRAGTLNR